MHATTGSPGASRKNELDELEARIDAMVDRFESELKRGFAIMLFTSQAVLIAILSVLILAFD